MRAFLKIIAVVLAGGFLPAPARADAVSLEDTGDAVVLSNGVISATIGKASASIRSLRFQGAEFVRQQRGGVYFSMDGGKNFRVPAGCEFRVHHRTDDTLDVAMLQKWSGQKQAVDIDIHYVLRAGDSGLYSYAVVSHPAEYPATGFGEWRIVWKLPDNLLDTICVDRLRFHEMPTAEDFARAESTPIREIVKLTTGKWAGRYNCKYDYNAEYHSTPFWGHADSRSGFGAWVISGAHEWYNDGPFKQDLTSADRIIHLHFGMNHFNASSTRLEAGEEWRKTYGPFLLYLNKTSGGVNAVVRDARLRQEKEKAAWPYAWLKPTPDTPPARARGTASGKFFIDDPAKPTLTSANAWIGLAQPEPGGNWQFESKRYQHWTRVKPDGTFVIPHARPGNYQLFAVVEGAHGEFGPHPVTIKAGAVTPLGSLTWRIPRTSGRLVWEIGVPDRRAAEFRHGDSYFQGYLWKKFAEEWPNPLDFHIGKSNPAKDWNYAHTAYVKPGAAPEGWKWRVHFDLPDAPQGDGTLTIGIASADGARLAIYLNDEKRPVQMLDPAVQGGNVLFREAIHGKYCHHRVPLPRSALRAGPNVLTLVQSRTHSQAFHVMYDALSLEVP